MSRESYIAGSPVRSFDREDANGSLSHQDVTRWASGTVPLSVISVLEFNALQHSLVSQLFAEPCALHFMIHKMLHGNTHHKRLFTVSIADINGKMDKKNIILFFFKCIRDYPILIAKKKKNHTGIFSCQKVCQICYWLHNIKRVTTF